MSYQINKTNGDLLTDLIDGQIDQNSTNLTLVGRNYTGYGEFFNENFVKLLENFSSTAAPSNPLEGQLWWDNLDQRLKVFDGTQWKASGGPFVQDSAPSMVAGDLWINNLTNQLYAYDGSDLILIGPQYTEQQGESGFRIGSILDEQSRSRTVVYLYIGGELTGLFSNLEFRPIYSQRVLGLVSDSNPDGIIFKGFNVIDKDNFKYIGIAESANALVTQAGVVRTADSFLPSNANGITTGTLSVQNSGGLTIGLSQNHVQKVIGDRFYFENQLTNHDMSFRVSSDAFGALTVDAIYVDAEQARVGIFNIGRLPEYTLDVEGDLRVTGNLLVEGETTSIDVATLRVEDKNIEIAKTSDGTTLTGAEANNAGLILDTSDSGSKTLTWITASDAWTSNVHINLSNTNSTYQIGGEDKLTNTSLTNITTATDLVVIESALQYLNIDDINIDGATITNNEAALGPLTLTSSTGLNITAGGDIAIQDDRKITGLATTNPSTGDDKDATNKIYVDTQIAVEPIVFSMDITGLGIEDELTDNVATYLEDMYPASSINSGKIAKIHATSYAGATVDGVGIENIKTITFISVDKNGTENQPVVQDVTFNPAGASGNVILEPIRTLMTYRSSGTAWEYQRTEPYS